jgi:pentatricopeptide repeat protein
MQPFLSRCSISTAILTTPRNMAQSKDAGTNAISYGKSSLFRRFGDFYMRFYSTMSEEPKNGCKPPKNETCFGETVPREENAVFSREKPEEPGASGLNWKRKGGPWPPVPPTGIIDHRTTRTVNYTKVRGGGVSRRHSYTADEITEKAAAEKAVHELVKRVEDHDRLVRSLEMEIRRRNLLISTSKSKEKVGVHDQELHTLEDLYIHITRCHYTAEAGRLIAKAVLASRARVIPGLRPFLRPYIPPFPNYRSREPPVALNKSLLNLFHPRTLGPRLLLKICYNLLTSSSAPDIKTYNILIRGFTILRQNSLAHMVFQSMLARGVDPDAYSTVALINLSVKSSDFESYERIMQYADTGPVTDEVENKQQIPGGGKTVLEAMINGAARFGQAKRIKVYTRAIKRYYPDSPGLSLFLLTSMLRLWTESRDWPKGRQLWSRMKGLERAAPHRGESFTIDLRAYRQMYYLCRACRKPEWSKAILAEARERGWAAARVIAPAEKSKGIHYTSEVKAPRLSQITRIYTRYTVKRKNRPHLKDMPARNHLLGTLEQGYDLMGINTILEPIYSRQDESFKDNPADVFLNEVDLPYPCYPPEGDGKVEGGKFSQWNGEGESTEAMQTILEVPAQVYHPLITDQDRSRIWSSVISRRIKNIRLQRSPPHPPSASSTESSESLTSSAAVEELVPSTRSAFSIEDYTKDHKSDLEKSDLIAFSRGCE